jgi:diaminohydroxyphosphoribosylaminopyrimidine deaminase / 5-amino-6-(5-phosphoribosylamino)uracil reductase
MVGALVVRRGEVVGEGWHREVGGPHAEVEALAAAGKRARGATLYVTLEPCAHHGRTPPCADAIIAAGVRRVVACHLDPDPRTRGRGFAALERAGIAVERGLLIEAAVRLNLAFLTSVIHGRPAVTLKWAMSLDGKIATASGESRWISSREGRRWSLLLREEQDAIAVGSGTVLADDPLLTRRLGKAGRPNLRVVLDRRLRTPPAAKLLGEPGEVLVYTESKDSGRRRALEERGATVVASARVTPAAVLEDLQRRGVRSLLVEGGGAIHAAFTAAGLYDRVAIDCAPLLIGGSAAPSPVGGDGVKSLAVAPRLVRLHARRAGSDVILMGEREGCLPDLSSNVAG